MDWDNVRVFLAIARCGSVIAAARELKVNPSTVTRRLASFEERLKVRLFERRPTGYVATQAGEALLDTASRVQETLAEIESRITGQDDAIEGRVRLTLPPGTLPLLADDIATFLADNPAIELDIREDLRPYDLSKFEADVAVRLTNRPAEGLYGRKIADVAGALYASESYLRNLRPGAVHQFIGPVGAAGSPACYRESYGPVRMIARVDSALSRCELAASGAGVTWLPCCIGDLSPLLLRVPHLGAVDKLEMWVLTHPELRKMSRVATTLRMLGDAAKRRADLLAGFKPRALPPSIAPMLQLARKDVAN